jgi:NADH-ubiquinone oxidoreductase chain 6
LDILSLLAILSGILVIISKNPIVSVLFLIGLFLSISSYLIILGLSFVGLSYLLVYVGAVSILFLFILMLINIRVSELLSYTSNSIPLAILITISFNYPIYQMLPYSIATFNSYTVNLNNTLNDIWSNNYSDYLNKVFNLNTLELDKGEIYFVTSKIWDGNLSETNHITSIGNIMYTSYSIWLIITSIILLLAMVGAIVITIKQRN